jgi:hypothetical protein
VLCVWGLHVGLDMKCVGKSGVMGCSVCVFVCVCVCGIACCVRDIMCREVWSSWICCVCVRNCAVGYRYNV